MFAFLQVRLATICTCTCHARYHACLCSCAASLSLLSPPLPSLPSSFFPSPRMPKMEKLCGHLSLKEAKSCTEKSEDRRGVEKPSPKNLAFTQKKSSTFFDTDVRPGQCSTAPPYDLWQNERVCPQSFLAFFCLLFVAPPCWRKKNHCVVCEQIFLMKGLIEKKTKKMKLLSTSDWPLLSHSCLRPVTQSIRGEKMEAGEGGGPRLPLAQMGFH